MVVSIALRFTNHQLIMRTVAIYFVLSFTWISYVHSASYLNKENPYMNFDCDVDAAFKCESDFLNCKLFSGPADDAETLCKCGEEFYGDCLRKAGCQTYPQVDELSNNEIYMKLCVNHIINNNCPSTLMCSMNCASDGSIDPTTSKIIPFNNFGVYYLRIRICLRKVHTNKRDRYAVIDAAACDTLADFDVCSRWIPPKTFVPVALPINTTYIEVDSCEINADGEKFCRTSNPSPVRIYGNQYIFPRTFDVPQTKESICAKNDDCLGTFCDFKFNPPMCSPKTLRHVSLMVCLYLICTVCFILN